MFLSKLLKSKKTKWLMLLGSFAMAMGIGATIGANAATQETEVVETKADVTYTGSIGIECQHLGNYYWDDAGAVIGVYFKDSTGALGAWGSGFASGSTSHFLSVPYSLSFDPFGGTIELYRYPSGTTAPYFDNEGTTWAVIKNVSFGQIAYIWGSGGGSASSGHTSPSYIDFNSSGWGDQVFNRLSYTQYSGGHWEFYGSYSFSQGDYGKITIDNDREHGRNAIDDSVDGNYYYVDSGHYEQNMNCRYYNPSCNVYHNLSNSKTYFTISDRAVAEKWGATFLDTVTCSGETSGSITSDSDAWTSTMKGAYDALTKDQQGEVWKIAANDGGTFLERAVYRYDFIMHKYGTSTYTDFIGRKNSGGGYSMGTSVYAPFTQEQSPLTTTLWIVLASGIAGLGAIGAAYFISKKKRHKA